MTRRTTCFRVAAAEACAGLTVDVGSVDASRGASGWSLGTGITGVPMVGIASDGSAGFDEKF